MSVLKGNSTKAHGKVPVVFALGSFLRCGLAPMACHKVARVLRLRRALVQEIVHGVSRQAHVLSTHPAKGLPSVATVGKWRGDSSAALSKLQNTKTGQSSKCSVSTLLCSIALPSKREHALSGKLECTQVRDHPKLHRASLCVVDELMTFTLQHAYLRWSQVVQMVPRDHQLQQRLAAPRRGMWQA